MEHFEPVQDLPDGWQILAGGGIGTRHWHLTLKVPEWAAREQDEDEFRRVLRERLHAFGDTIMEGWRHLRDQERRGRQP